MRKAVFVVVGIGIILSMAALCGADINYDFVNKDGQVEDKVAPMVRKILSIIIGLGAGLSIIALGVGACQWFGHLAKEDKESGKSKMKSGGIGIFVFGLFYSILATAFSIAGIS